MSKSIVISGIFAAGAWLAPMASADVPSPQSAEDIFSFEYSRGQLTQPDGLKSVEQRLKREARKYCAVGHAPGVRRAARACERKVVKQVKAELMLRTNTSAAG